MAKRHRRLSAGQNVVGLDEDVVSLGMVLKNLDNFDMSDFGGRLTLQKSVYLLQSFGVYMGYRFSWYVRGPYSTRLASNGFALRGIYGGLPAGAFGTRRVQSKFERFLGFMRDKKDDPDRLEILASIHFLRSVYKAMPKPKILTKVKNKQSYFTGQQCQEGWAELREWDLI